MKTIAFFNNKGGVGTTSLVYHLGWTYSEMGKRVLLVDLDPQSNLTSICVDEERVEQLWADDDVKRKSMQGAVQPIIDGIGDIGSAHLERVNNRISLIPGDIRLSEFEQKLSDAWPRCMDRDPASFRVVSSFYRVIEQAGADHDADIVLIDVGPNLGATNRSALIAADHVVIPLGADLFSIQGLRNLGPTLVRWRDEWLERSQNNPIKSMSLPQGGMRPLGYVVMQPSHFSGQETHAYQSWLAQIPGAYANSVMQRTEPTPLTVAHDPSCLAVLKHYRSFMPMAQTAHKPIFKLTAADGAIGAQSQAVRQIGLEFQSLGKRILARVAE